MYRDYKVRLKMSMFRPIKQEDYIDVYENPYAMITAEIKIQKKQSQPNK